MRLFKFYIFLFLAMISLKSFAYDYEMDGLFYNLNDETSSAEVTYKKYNVDYIKGEIIIPSSIIYHNKEYDVNTIGDYAFQACSIESIIIPNTIVKIGVNAFERCHNLTKVKIPDSVKQIGYFAFYWCSNIYSVEIGDSVESLEEGTFGLCSDLKNIKLGNSVSFIGNFAFNDCKQLEEISIPNSVLSIGEGAFNGCNSLRIVNMGSSVSEIGKDAFYNCTKIDAVYIEDLSQWCNIVFQDWEANPLYYASYFFIKNEVVKDLVIPEDVVSIGDFAFINQKRINSVRLPDSLNSIGKAAFEGCENINDVYINNLLSWCKIRFQSGGNPKISRETNIYINNDILTEIIIPDEIIEIGNYTFSTWSEITKVIFPKTILSIGERAFAECFNLEEIELPETVKTIGESAFYWCSSLKNFIIPNSVETIGRAAFADCYSLSEIHFGNSITTIGDFAFNGCGALTNIKLPDSLIYIGATAFQSCSSLSSFRIPDKVTSIEDFTYGLCSKLATFSIGKSVEILGNQVFNLCRNLETINCYAATPPSCNSKTFLTNNLWSMTLHVPEGTREAYANAFYWMDFGTIIDDLTDEIYPEEISLNITEAEIELGQTLQLEATVLPEDTTNKTIVWNSSDSSIATVSEEGFVNAVSLGSATIIATCGDKSATCSVTVINPFIYPQEIILNVEEVEMELGETLQLEATVLPVDTTVKTLIWNSSDPSIATVSEDGFVTAMSVGTATIKVTCGEILASCLVTVVDPTIYPQKILLNVTEAEIELNETLKLEATVLPEDSTDKTVIWNSSNPSIATVSEVGLVTAIIIGSTTITATCGEVSATCEITVVEDAGIESLFSDSENIIDIYSPAGILIKRNVTPEDLKLLDKGIYILKSKGKSYKVNLK